MKNRTFSGHMNVWRAIFAVAFLFAVLPFCENKSAHAETAYPLNENSCYDISDQFFGRDFAQKIFHIVRDSLFNLLSKYGSLTVADELARKWGFFVSETPSGR